MARHDKALIEFQGLLQLFDCLIIVTCHQVMPSQVRVHTQVEGVEFQTTEAFRERFLKPAHGYQIVRVPVMSFNVIRIQIQRELEFSFGAQPVPVKIHVDMCQRVMRFGQRIIYLQGLHRRRSRFDGCMLRRYFHRAAVRIAISQSGIGQCVVRIYLNRPLIVLNGFVVTF